MNRRCFSLVVLGAIVADAVTSPTVRGAETPLPHAELVPDVPDAPKLNRKWQTFAREELASMKMRTTPRNK